MNKRRLLGISIFFAVLAGSALYFLLDRMIINQQAISSARYFDKKLILAMENLIHENAFKIVGNEIIIDEEVMAKQNMAKNTMEQLRRNISHLSVKDNRIYFDHQAVSIVKLHDIKMITTLRGKILDRKGIVLAQSMLDEKKWTLKREYPFGPACYPLTGHDNIVYGKRNLEKHLNLYLDGLTHEAVYLPTNEPFRKLKSGDDVFLTIDSQLQQAAYRSMAGFKGAIVVLDVETGEILALVSIPSIDPNEKSSGIWRREFSDKVNKSYENRSISTLYPTGSTFKTITAAAWLEHSSRKIDDIHKKISCGGHKKNRFGISDIHGHGVVSIESAFVFSCNQYFSEIGVELGKETLFMAERFGFNRRIKLLPQMNDVQFEAETSRAFSWSDNENMSHSSSAAINQNMLKIYRDIDFRRNPKIVAQCAIGQNLISATPMQMAMVAGAIANQGKVMNPYIVSEVRAGNGSVLFKAIPVNLGQAMRASNAHYISQLMEKVMRKGTAKNVRKLYRQDNHYITIPVDAVVNHPHQSVGNDVGSDNLHPGASSSAGLTAMKSGKISQYEIALAGKTGTAEVGDRNGNGVIDADEKPHSWFIGFAPAKAPKVAIAVIAENQGFGSLTAAPIAVDVIAVALNGLSNNGK